MQEFIEKLIGRLEEEQKKQQYLFNNVLNNDNQRMVHAYAEQCYLYMTEIVNQLAEEHRFNPSLIDDIKAFLKMKFEYCAEQAGMNLEAECNSEIASYFRDRKELYLDRANIYGEVMREIDRLAEEHNNGFCEWKPTSEDLLKPYESSCGKFALVNPTWGYCPYCGEKIKVAPYQPKGE